MWRNEHERRKVAVALARALLGGAATSDATIQAMEQRTARALGKNWPWVKGLVRRIRSDFGSQLLPADHDEIAQRIFEFRPLVAAFETTSDAPRVCGHFPFHPTMRQSALPGIALPPLATPGDLARWLGLSKAELDWFADAAGWGGRATVAKLRHYDYRWLPKPNGGARLIEAPKSRLREIQRRILHEILERVPCHDAAHGCVGGRSALTNARLHVARALVIRLDLADFFTSIRGARIHALFTTLGYPAATARYLTGLTTHCTPHGVIGAVPIGAGISASACQAQRAWARRFLTRHLPQGAPSSPALANLCAYRLDLRLAAAARSSGARYSRYVDDLILSTDSASTAKAGRMAQMAYTIVIEEGFAPNVRKTRVMPKNQAQRVTGLTVNDKPNLSRRDFDSLKAILTNCGRHGAATQNRDQHPNFRDHLLGRIAYFGQVHPARGAKLKALFERISWA
jgi:RNA-directed DNA polymerase